MSIRSETERSSCEVVLIDGSSFLYRAYYALSPLTTREGVPVQAVYGFCRMIKKVIDRFNPRYCAVVWDMPGKTVRHEFYHEYKATRQAPPADFSQQKELVFEFAKLIGLHQIFEQGVEADDLIISLARVFEKKGCSTFIISSDKDLGQALSSTITLYDPFKDELFDKQKLEALYGFPLEKLPFYYALVGDSSDNIPGVRGVGPKTAFLLVQQYESLHDLYEHLDEIESKRVHKLLSEGREKAFLSERLFQAQPVAVDGTLEHFTLAPDAFVQARPFFERLHFVSLAKQINPASPATVHSFAERYGYTFYKVITIDELMGLERLIAHAGACAFDTETTGDAVRSTTLVGVSLCCKEGASYYIPIGHETGETQLPREVVIRHLKVIFENERIKKYAHHANYDLMVLRGVGIMVRGLVFDTMIAAGLVRENDTDRLGLKMLSLVYFNEEMRSCKDVIGKHKNFAYVPLDEAYDYAAADAHQTWKLQAVLEKALVAQRQEALFYTIEMPLISVLCDMQWEGIELDRGALEVIGKKIEHRLHAVQKEIFALAGLAEGEVNLSSPAQVADLLFKRLNLEPVKSKKTGTSLRYSTDNEVLETLAKSHPIPALLITYRELSKLKGTYIDGLKEAVNRQTGRIHTTFKQASVATGRLSSTDPNLQNIPTGEDDEFAIRSAFKAPLGCSFIAADYSQVELRVLACLAKDERLLNAFKSGEDIHTQTAAAIFRKSTGEVTPGERKIAKRINFSILYGVTPFGLSKDLGISSADAKEYIERYMEQYPRVQAWMEEVVAETHKNGYVETFFGRRRPLPGIYERNKNLYQLARRVAINTRVQGTAAELMKKGMINLYDALNKLAASERPHLILQIHDELVVVAPDELVKEVSQLMKKELQSVVDWEIPFEVDIQVGKSWQDVSR